MARGAEISGWGLRGSEFRGEGRKERSSGLRGKGLRETFGVLK